MSDGPQTTSVSLNAQLLSDGKGEVPDWVHLLPTSDGLVQTNDARGPYHVSDAEKIISASFAEADRLPIDENPATDLAAPKGLPAPARGWIVSMQARADGNWGKVEWSDQDRSLLPPPTCAATNARRRMRVGNTSPLIKPKHKGGSPVPISKDEYCQKLRQNLSAYATSQTRASMTLGGRLSVPPGQKITGSCL